MVNMVEEFDAAIKNRRQGRFTMYYTLYSNSTEIVANETHI